VKVRRSMLTLLVGFILAQSAHADYTPDNTYLVCGRYLVAIEVPLLQRLENRRMQTQESSGAGLMFDIVLLVDGRSARHLDADLKGKAYSDRIEMWSGLTWYWLDRVKGSLYGEKDFTVEERLVRMLREERGLEVETKWEFVATCEVSSKRAQKAIVDAHNKAVEKDIVRKF